MKNRSFPLIPLLYRIFLNPLLKMKKISSKKEEEEEEIHGFDVKLKQEEQPPPVKQHEKGGPSDHVRDEKIIGVNRHLPCRRSPNFAITGENSFRILYLDGLGMDITEYTINEVFNVFGTIELVDLDRNHETESSNAYIQFCREEDAQYILRMISGGLFQIGGYVIRASLIGGSEFVETTSADLGGVFSDYDEKIGDRELQGLDVKSKREEQPPVPVKKHEKGGPSTDPLDEDIIRLNQQLPSFYRSSISPDYDPKYVRKRGIMTINENTDKRLKYMEQVYFSALEGSEGFDVPRIPYQSDLCGMIHPYPVIEETREKLLSVANEGMEQYEKDNGIKYEVVGVEKCMRQTVAGFIYFITFVAKRTGDGITDKPETFEAKVCCGIRKKAKVKFCRKKDEEKMIGRKKMGRYELNC